MVQELSTREKEHELKVAFADAWLRYPSDPFKAALNIAKGDTLTALTILDRYQRDPEIYDIKAMLIDEFGEEEFLPTKEQMIRGVLDRAERAVEDSDYCRLMSLAFDARGMTSKSGGGNTNVVINNATDNRTMHIPVMINNNGSEVTDEEWQDALMKQQRSLVSSNE